MHDDATYTDKKADELQKDLKELSNSERATLQSEQELEQYENKISNKEPNVNEGETFKPE